MVKTMVLIILILFQMNNVFCQTILKGIVQTAKKQPVAGANIYFKGTIEGTTSGEDGKFILSTNQTGEQVLVISSLGYKTHEESVKLQNKVIELHIALIENEVELKEVVVYSGTFEAGDKKKSVVLNRLDMATNPIGFGDALSVIRTLPGTGNAGDEGGLIVRGGEQSETKTFVDGLLVESPYTAKLPNVPVRGRFSPMLFKGTIFSTGGYSAEYGQALSSVLILNSIDRTEKDETSFSLFFPGANINKSKKWENSSLSASSQYVNMSPFYKITGSNIKWNHAPENFNQMVAYRHKIGTSGLIKIMTNFSIDKSSMHYRNLDTRQIDLISLNNNDLCVVSAYKGTFGKDWIVNSGISYNYDKVNIKLNEDNIEDTKQSYEFKLSFAKSINEHIKLKFGGNLFQKNFSRNYLVYAEDSLMNWSLNNPLYAAFIESECKLFKRISLRTGGRIESIPLSDEITVSPRVSFAYKTSANSQISVGYGIFSEQSQTDYLLYNQKLRTERADHYIINYQLMKDSRIFRIETYYKKYTGLVKYDSLYAIAPEAYNNSGSGYAKGFDLFYRDSKSIKNGDFWISYSLIDSKRNYKDYRFTHTPFFISKHNLSVVYKHYINKTDSYISAGYEYSSGRTYIDPNTGISDLKRTKPYNSLSVSIFHFTQIFGKFTMLFAQVTNVLGSENIFGYRFAKSPDEHGVYESVPLIPVSRRFYMVGMFVSFNGKPEI
jgi:hypothetical protein